MNLSAHYLNLIDASFEKREHELQRLNPKLAEAMQNVAGDEATLLHFYIGQMSNVDLINLSFDVLIDFAKESLASRTLSDENLPEDIWLNYVAWFRVNTESIVKHRGFFREQLLAIDLGLSNEDKILRVNEWCAEQVSYRSTDSRTINPLTLFGKVYGRCGEESTFLVSSLRSIGIPARQIYVPWWSHCDDNHAWVEVWTGKGWVFLGACEPEPMLNRGWFTEAASRAMLVITRSILPPASEALLPYVGKELLINRLPFYAKPAYVDLNLTFGEEAAAEAECRFEIFNYGAFVRLSTLLADESGHLRLAMGLGTVRLICRYRDRLFQKDLVLSGDVSLGIDMAKARLDKTPEVGAFEVDFIAPKAASVHHRPLSKQEQVSRAATLLRVNQKREEKLACLSHAKARQTLLATCPEAEGLAERFLESRAHFPVIEEFLSLAQAEQKTLEALAILASLSLKDFSDVPLEVLVERLKYVPAWEEKTLPVPDQTEAIWPSVYSPRVEIESLDLIYSEFSQLISEEQRQAFYKNPLAILSFIEAYCADDSGTSGARYSTELSKLWRARVASEHEKELLFVSLARFCHLPAKLALSDGRAMYYQNGVWKKWGESRQKCVDSGLVKLRLESRDELQWRYQMNWSLDLWSEEKAAFVNLRAADYPALENVPCSLDLPSGYYRINSNNRLPNGNGLVRSECFYLHAERECVLQLKQRKAAQEDLLLQISLDPIGFFYDQKGQREGEDLCSLIQDDYGLLLWLDPLQEPSVHVLAELLEHQKELLEADLPVIMVLSREAVLSNYEILNRVLVALPRVRIVFGEAEEGVARQVCINPELLPRALLVHPSGIAHYAEAGYKVGQIPLVLDLLDSVRRSS